MADIIYKIADVATNMILSVWFWIVLLVIVVLILTISLYRTLKLWTIEKINFCR